jgi:peptidylprolyl isomerase
MKYIVLAVVIAVVIFYFTKNSNDKKAAEENIKIGRDFLEKNKDKEGVLETASGLQYQVL